MADEPKIHIDSDWKAQAQAEREKLRESEQKKKAEEGAKSPQPSGGQPGEAGPSDEGMGEEGREMPPANFDTLMQTLASNALLAMGAVPDPETGQRYAHMGLAKYHIDMLGVVQEKTKGNLSEEEEQMLSTTLYELRNAFVQLAEQARQMQMQGPGQGQQAPGAAGGAGPQPGPGMQGPGGPLRG